MIKILKCANVWLSRFFYFKVNFNSELQWICNERTRSIAQVSYETCSIKEIIDQCEFTANSMQFSTLKSGQEPNICAF